MFDKVEDMYKTEKPQEDSSTHLEAKVIRHEDQEKKVSPINEGESEGEEESESDSDQRLDIPKTGRIAD